MKTLSAQGTVAMPKSQRKDCLMANFSSPTDIQTRASSAPLPYLSADDVRDGHNTHEGGRGPVHGRAARTRLQYVHHRGLVEGGDEVPQADEGLDAHLRERERKKVGKKGGGRVVRTSVGRSGRGCGTLVLCTRRCV